MTTRLYHPLNFKGSGSNSPTPPSGKTIVDFFSEPGVNDGSIVVKDDSSDHVKVLQPQDNDPTNDYVVAQVGLTTMWVRPDTLRGSLAYLFNTTIPTPPIGSLVTKDNVGIANMAVVTPPDPTMERPTLRFGTHATEKNLPQWEPVPTLYDVFGEPLIGAGSIAYKENDPTDRVGTVAPPSGSLTDPKLGYNHVGTHPSWVQDRYNAIPDPPTSIQNPRLGFNRTTSVPEWIDDGVTPTPINQTIEGHGEVQNFTRPGSNASIDITLGKSGNSNVPFSQLIKGRAIFTAADPTIADTTVDSRVEIDWVRTGTTSVFYDAKSYRVASGSFSQIVTRTNAAIDVYAGTAARGNISLVVDGTALKMRIMRSGSSWVGGNTNYITEIYEHAEGNPPTPPTPPATQTIKKRAYADYIWTMPIVTGGQEDIEFGNLASPGAVSNAVPRNRLLSGWVLLTWSRINSGVTDIAEYVEIHYSRNSANSGFEFMMKTRAYNSVSPIQYSWNEAYIRTGAVQRIKIVPNRGGLGNTPLNAHCTNVNQDNRTDAIYMAEQFTYIDDSSEEMHFGKANGVLHV